MEFVEIIPVFLNTASYILSFPPKEPVWLITDRSAASVPPANIATIGFLGVISRAKRMNSFPLLTSSKYIPITSV